MSRPEAWVVFDLGFGDAGKGSVTDFLVRDRAARLVVRFNGGAQAGHNVVAPDGRHHTFSQFGAGTFVPGVETHLGPEFVLHPLALLVEARRLAERGVADALDRLTVDGRALLISPFQQAAGRLRELLRGPARHGTCGVGIGEAVGDARDGADDVLLAGDLEDHDRLVRGLRRQQERKRSELHAATGRLDDPRADAEVAWLDDPQAAPRVAAAWSDVARQLRVLDEKAAASRLRHGGPIVFEGAQGVLLDQSWGFAPHTTWSDCTPGGALRLLNGLEHRVVRLGVLRAYATRHGEGPLPTEDARMRELLPDSHNDSAGWQGAFRVGALDFVLLRYALEVCWGADALALTCLDRVAAMLRLPFCTRYRAVAPQALVERDREGGIVRLLPGPISDADHRRALTELALRAAPSLEAIEPGALPALIERELGVPVALVSAGETAAAKRWKEGGPGLASAAGSTANTRVRLQPRAARAIN